MKILRIFTALLMIVSMASCRHESTDPDEMKEYVIADISYEIEPSTQVAASYEPIFEDDTYYYYLTAHESQYFIVTYTNGEKQNIKEALNVGNVTIDDLFASGFNCEKELKTPVNADVKKVISIRNTIAPDSDLPDVEELFWEDERYIYIFGNPISEYVIVEYSDGSTENVKEALEDRHIVITDLDTYGISYFTEPMLIDNIIFHTDRGAVPADMLEPFYEDGNYIYSFSSPRSEAVIVYFKDGTEKPIKEALADGTVRISDLDRFGIKYYKDKKETKSPIGYGSEVTAFNNIRELILQIETGTLNWAAQEIYDAHGCDIDSLRELTGMDDGFAEFLVEWCGGMNYSINYHKDDQIIVFMPCDSMERMNQAASAMDSWESLQNNKLLSNLVKTDMETDDGIRYECTYDTKSAAGFRMTYHETTDASGIRRVVTNNYKADGTHRSGAIYVFDESVPFYCLVNGLEADMEMAKRFVSEAGLDNTE